VVAIQVVAGWSLLAFAAFLIYLIPFGMLWGAGYSPASKKQLKAAAALLELKDGDTVYDLGSGFGRALIFFAKEYRIHAIGAEVDPLRRAVSVWSARRRGVSTSVAILRKNLLDVDLQDTAKVFFFLSPLLMRKLQEKLGREMPPGALVASVEHRFPDWKPVKSRENVHLYVVPTPKTQA
jgi:SAM-dependent methyltransferase